MIGRWVTLRLVSLATGSFLSPPSPSLPAPKFDLTTRRGKRHALCTESNRPGSTTVVQLGFTGAVLRIARQDLYWQGKPPPDTLAWRDVRLPPPPPSAAEPRFSKETAPGAWPDTPLDAWPAVQPLPWAGPTGGDLRLRRLVPMLLNRNPTNWALISTHIRGRSGKECRNRWMQIKDSV